MINFYIDEFLYLKKYKNIKKFLINRKFDKCESIQLNWVHMSDNNQIFYENIYLHERFQEKGKNVMKNKNNTICFVKTITRGHLQNITINQNHVLSQKLKACNGFGGKSQVYKILSLHPDYKFNFVRHYYTKSVQEFIEKIDRGDLLRGNKKKIIECEKFFMINEITFDKIVYIRKHLGKKI